MCQDWSCPRPETPAPRSRRMERRPGCPCACTRRRRRRRRSPTPFGRSAPTCSLSPAPLAGWPGRVYARDTTPKPILDTISTLGADLQLVAGHIGDAGKLARAFAAESGYFDVSTLREPYRIEGKKTMGIELAEQLGWTLPTHIIYPTGGGTGLIGMWKVFAELRDGGWLPKKIAMPKVVGGEASGWALVARASCCAPMVRAFHEHAEKATPWENPTTHASGLRVPGPLGDRLILRALKESHGDAHAVSEDAIRSATLRLSRMSGVDAAPEGGCALAVTEQLVTANRIPSTAEVLVFNTGSGASYRF